MPHCNKSIPEQYIRNLEMFLVLESEKSAKKKEEGDKLMKVCWNSTGIKLNVNYMRYVKKYGECLNKKILL